MLPRLLSTYRALALLCLNTFLVFALMNGCAAGLLSVLPDRDVEGAMGYGLEKLEQVYPHRDGDEIRRLLTETWSRPYIYEPYTQFKESSYSGEFINVGAEGFRDTGHGLPWPPSSEDLTILVFGGSTTFGYGLADEETIPARLQDALSQACARRVAVFNMARSNYFSSQENVLFQRLLVQGITASAAVFIDGLNEFGHADDAPKFTDRLTYLMEETPAQAGRRVVVGLPLARLAKRWLRRPDLAQKREARPEEALRIVDRWLGNRAQIRAAAAAAGVQTLFVWQPIPSYGYSREHHLFVGDGGSQEQTSAAGYDLVDRLRNEPGGVGEDLLWLADLQRDREEPLYVDQVHYTAAFSTEIAEAIALTLAPRLCPVR